MLRRADLALKELLTLLGNWGVDDLKPTHSAAKRTTGKNVFGVNKTLTSVGSVQGLSRSLRNLVRCSTGKSDRKDDTDYPNGAAFVKRKIRDSLENLPVHVHAGVLLA
jgi:hypothetical protein